MKVAIHQPNFMPWAGYFYKLLRSDIFIFFDTVQFPRGKSYCSRVKIKSPRGVQWLTVPVTGKGRLLPIKDVQISGDAWTKKHLGNLKNSYGKSSFFIDYIDGIEEVYNRPGQSVACFNIELITYLANVLGAKTKLCRASHMGLDINETGEYILALVESVGGTTYITGQGEGTWRYFDEQKFDQAGINVEIFNYKYPRYQQLWGDFVSGLSVVDVLFNTGPQARDIILSGGIKE